MTSSANGLPPSGLTNPSRYITTHNTSGKAIFSTQIPPSVPAEDIPTHPMAFRLMYTASTLPAQLSGEKDITEYTQYLKAPPKLAIPGGSVGRMVDFPPGYTSAMHRTVSLDLGIVIDGEIELALDSGETRRMGKGDVAVQRGTNHAWRNVSEERWARMFFVLQGAEPVKLGSGEGLAVDLGGIETSWVVPW